MYVSWMCGVWQDQLFGSVNSHTIGHVCECVWSGRDQLHLFNDVYTKRSEKDNVRNLVRDVRPMALPGVYATVGWP